jgi:hypothetical protein
MIEKRRWPRSAPMNSMPKVGKILLAGGLPPIECRVLNVSVGGAGLELPRLYELPEAFEFHHGSSQRICNVVWRDGFRLGVSYADVARVSSSLSSGRSGASWLSRPRR